MVVLLPRLRGFARSLTNSVTDADDLLQSTVEKALSKVDEKHSDAPLDRWMFRIMKNIRLNQYRKPTEDLRDPQAFNGVDFAMDGVRYFEARLTLNVVLREFEQLSEQHREILYLVCVEGLAYKETSEILEIPLGTVMSRLARARLALHERLQGIRSDKSDAGIRTPLEDDNAFER
jgi:RNA polymerase sigma-70 factor (ECF subfamily)